MTVDEHLDDEAAVSVLGSFARMRESWMADARCRGMEPKKFFPDRGKSSIPAARECVQCPVRFECLSYARRTGSEYGIWGGVHITRGEEKKIQIPTPKKKAEPMLPKTFSATSTQAFLECPKMYEAEYLNRTPSPNNSAAALGSACHNAFEAFVKEECHLLQTKSAQRSAMASLYGIAYWELFADGDRFDEGLKMCHDWVDRMDWSDREVLSTEEKKNFPIKTSVGTIPFTYIMDRVDKIKSTGEIEVVDYKSISRPISPEELFHKLQARAYGLAAQLEHPDAERIRVTFDLLRFEPVSVLFTKEDNRATWKLLHDIGERIVTCDNPKEVLGDGCTWCIRRDQCDALFANVEAGGTLKYGTLAEAAQRLFEVDNAASALSKHKVALEKIVLDLMRDDEAVEAVAGDFAVSVSISGKRAVDRERVRQLVGDDMLLRWGCSKVGEVDAMLEQETDIDSTTKSLVRQSFRQNYGDPKARVRRNA